MWLLLALPGIGVGLYPAPMPVPAHFSDWSAIAYREKIAALCRSHVVNHRSRAVARSWSWDRTRYTVTAFDSQTLNDVCGKWGWVHTRTGDLATGVPYSRFHYIDPLGQYLSERIGGPKPLDFVRASPVGNRPDVGWYGITFGAFNATHQIYQPSRTEKLVTHEDATFEGRQALRLVTRDEKLARTVHIAKDTYQLLAADGTEPNGTGQVRVTYREAEGMRYPTRYRQSIRDADGTTRVVFDLEIIEYVRHVPIPDELDIEKRFGVQLPDFRPPPPTPPDPEHDPNLQRLRDKVAADRQPKDEPRSSIPFVVGCVLAFMFLGFLTFPLWRRRRRAE